MTESTSATPRNGQTSAPIRTIRRPGRPSTASILAYTLLFTWAILSLFPMYWMLATSLKEGQNVMRLPPELWPTEPSLENYRALFRRGDVLRWLFNSLLTSLAVTLGHVLFGAMAGYAFAKKIFPGRDALFWLLLASTMVLGWTTIIPLYMMVARLDWLNTYQGLIVPSLASAGAMFLMKQAMSTLPSELLDAARIDGASELGIFWQIVLPLSKPGLAVLSIFTFVAAWNEFTWPLFITSQSSMRTFQVGLTILYQTEYNHDANYGLLMAGASIAAIPVVGLFVFLQRYFLQGVTLGALKG